MIDTSNNKKKMSKGAIIAIVCSVIFVLILLGSILGSSGITNEEEKSNQPKITDYQVNETFKFDGLEITIKSWETTKYLKGDIKADDGYEWVVLNATIHNPKSETAYLMEGSLFPSQIYTEHLLYNGKVKYNARYYQYSDWILTHESIMPLGTLSGIYSFMVPSTVANSENSLCWEFTFNKVADQTQIARVKLR